MSLLEHEGKGSEGKVSSVFGQDQRCFPCCDFTNFDVCFIVLISVPTSSTLNLSRTHLAPRLNERSPISTLVALRSLAPLPFETILPKDKVRS